MKLAHWHKARGDEVVFTRRILHGSWEPGYRSVYGSAIFSFSADRVAKFRAEFPQAVIGGTHDLADNRTVEQLIEVSHTSIMTI